MPLRTDLTLLGYRIGLDKLCSNTENGCPAMTPHTENAIIAVIRLYPFDIKCTLATFAEFQTVFSHDPK